MYNALDVAAYVLNYSIDCQSPISNLSLQKILYYCQAAFLVEKDEPLFEEVISAWKYGPVVEEVYHEYKRYVNSPINKKIEKIQRYNFDGDNIYFFEDPYDVNLIITCEDTKRIINGIINAKNKYNAFELVEYTHDEDPWKNAIRDGNPEISIDSIRNYFSANRGRLWI